MRSQALRSASIRARALRLVMLLVFGVLAFRAGHLTLAGSQASERGDEQIAAKITLRGARGLIVDRSGRELAISVDAPSVFVLPQKLQDPERSLALLARILDLDRHALLERVAARSRFTYVARWIRNDQARAVQALDLPGVHIQREPRRTYPAGRMAAQLLGFANIDGVGVRGIEQMHDEWLRGSSHTVSLQRDARRRLLSSRSFDVRTVAGGDIMLTIHAGLQAQAEAALAEAVDRTGARGGIVIAVDPRTGDVLSLAEAPGFDPNDFRHTPYANTRSRAFLDALEPGSTMKAFLVAAAMDGSVISEDTAFDTGEGWMRIPGKTIRDHHPYGVIDVSGVLRFSSNIGAVLIAGELGAESHYAALQRFGFGRSTGSGFPSESPGLLRDWQDWKPVDHATLAFGQGMNVTAIQLAMATAALANGGRLMQPRLVLAQRRPTEPWTFHEPVEVGRAVSARTADKILGMLETVVSSEGTGRLAALAGVRVAGKTGTAQVLDAETGRYSSTRYTAWFVGVAPADDPRVTIVVALDEPTGRNHTGGSAAAPLFARIAAAQLAHRGVLTEPEPIPASPDPSWRVAMRAKLEKEEQTLSPPETTLSGQVHAVEVTTAVQSRVPDTDPIPVEPPATGARHSFAVASSPPAVAVTVFVPDFHGQSLDSAKRIAVRLSLDLQVTGMAGGWVVRQRPVAGTIVDGSQRTVLLSLSTQREEG